MKFLKKICLLSVILIFLTLNTPSVSVLASDEMLIFDNAGVLTEAEREMASSALSKASEEYDVIVAAYFADCFDYSLGNDSEEIATELYEDIYYGDDGVMLYVSMEEGEYYIVTSGSCIDSLNDFCLEYIVDAFIGPLSEGNYLRAVEKYANKCIEYLEDARVGPPYGMEDVFLKNPDLYDSDYQYYYDYEDTADEPFSPSAAAVFSLVIGFIVALVVTGTWKGQLKSVVQKSNASEYLRGGSLNLTVREDKFLYKTVNKRQKQTSNGGSHAGGGVARTHRSSSGRSYGGRGGKFR